MTRSLPPLCYQKSPRESFLFLPFLYQQVLLSTALFLSSTPFAQFALNFHHPTYLVDFHLTRSFFWRDTHHSSHLLHQPFPREKPRTSTLATAFPLSHNMTYRLARSPFVPNFYWLELRTGSWNLRAFIQLVQLNGENYFYLMSTITALVISGKCENLPTFKNTKILSILEPDFMGRKATLKTIFSIMYVYLVVPIGF